MEYQGIRINLDRDKLFTKSGLTQLRNGYMRPEETSPQHRYAFVSRKYGTNLEHAQRLYDYSSKHWLSYSTPILSTGKNARGQSISCFLPYLPDSSEGLVSTLAEVNWLSMLGGGVGLGVGIRATDDKSTGVMAHLKTYDASSLAYRQGSTRRGSYAAYLDISHPDIMPFIEIRKPTGDPNIRCLNLHHGINISDEFMKRVERCMTDPTADDSWELIDPASKEVRDIVSVKELWQRLLELRITTGEPYLHFIDESNRQLPQFHKDLGLSIKQSNLCSEIILPTDKDRTAVCCLSSLNLDTYDEWKDNKQFIHDVAEMLDNVLTNFIETAPTVISRAIYSAERERSIGVGALGLHSYLQSHMIPFESPEARKTNKAIFRHIRKQLDAANLNLGASRGEAPDAVGTGQRFSHVMAVAPNASSSIIVGNTSPSVEPYRANIYRQENLSGSFTNRNKHLVTILKDLDADGVIDYDEICSSVMVNGGSVQHLDCLTELQKAVFKTAMEIDQLAVVNLAADRQEFIDQSQSINLFFQPDADIKYLSDVHFAAWKQKLKTLYYCRSDKIGKADKISASIERKVIDEIPDTSIVSMESPDCPACEG